MPTTYTYPTDAALELIEQDFIDNLNETDPIFDLFPIVGTQDDQIVWEQRDNYQGLAQIRGMNGDPPSVKQVGAKRYLMQPSVYGEHMPIDELEMTRRRPLGQFNGQVSISDLVTERQNQLRVREMNRVRWVLWQLLINGTFNVFAQDGSLVASDSFKLTTYTPQVPWTTYATATPEADFRAIQLLNRGHSVSFGAGAVAFANQYTTNVMLSNANPNDLGGKRVVGGGTYNDLNQVNELYGRNGLARFVAYDDGYMADGNETTSAGASAGFSANSFQLYIPDGYVVVIGKRPNNAKVGEYRITRNANNADFGGRPYVKVIDHGERRVPRKIEVHRGHNGGPIVWFASAIVVAKVF